MKSMARSRMNNLETVETSRAHFEQMLRTMNQKGRFQSAVLATMNGLPIATVPSSFDAETTTAMVSLVRALINRVYHQLHLAKVDEVSLIGGDGKRLVCRYFTHDGEDFLLAVVAPPDQSYRRVTTQAIRAIKAALSG
jgi:predicted regulator of Ras-like GTPase activity (Roadblock/LC7/MglB family)